MGRHQVSGENQSPSVTGVTVVPAKGRDKVGRRCQGPAHRHLAPQPWASFPGARRRCTGWHLVPRLHGGPTVDSNPGFLLSWFFECPGTHRWPPDLLRPNPPASALCLSDSRPPLLSDLGTMFQMCWHPDPSLSSASQASCRAAGSA